MKHPSRSAFRVIAVLGMALSGISYVGLEYRWFVHSQPALDALDWNYFGAILPFDVLPWVWWALLAAWAVGSVAFVLFASWSRLLLGALLTAEFLVMPFQGLYVSTGIHDAIGGIGSLCFLVTFVLSFFEPCSRYFEREPNKEVATG